MTSKDTDYDPKDVALRADDDSSNRQFYVVFLDDVLSAVSPSIETFRGKIDYPVDRIAFSLYATLYQLACSIRLLARTGPSIAIPTLTRQAMDAFVDLLNVLSREHYWKQLEAADDQDRSKTLRHASTKKNPYLELLSQAGSELEDRRREQKERLAEWDRQGVKKADAEARFEMAGMKHDYDALWNVLSACTHNGVSRLLDRHFVEDGNSPPSFYLHPPRVEHELPSIIYIGDLLAKATEQMHQRYSSAPFNPAVVDRARDLLEKQLNTSKET